MRDFDGVRDITLRKACSGDASEIVRLCRESLRYACTTDEVCSRLDDLLFKETEIIIIAEANEKIVGFAHADEYRLLYQPPMMNLMGIAVDVNYRKMGIGHALLAAIEDIAQERGITGIRVISGIGREEAHAFYRAVGYTDAGDAKKFLKRL